MAPLAKSGTRVPDLVESYWRDIRYCEPLSRQEEAALFRKVRAGDDSAMCRVVTANLRFVVSVAREYSIYGLPLIELISEGNMGLLEAARRFDEGRGLKFITYAVWWIRQAILKALAQSGKAARPPMSRVNDWKKVPRKSGALTQQLGRTPTLHELAAGAQMSLERARNAFEVSRRDISLDKPLHTEDREDRLSSFVSEDADVEEDVEKVELARALRDCLASLDDREHQVICSYFGLEDREPLTLEQIGEAIGVTRERVRQIRNRALEKIRLEHGHTLMEFSRN